MLQIVKHLCQIKYTRAMIPNIQTVIVITKNAEYGSSGITAAPKITLIK